MIGRKEEVERILGLLAGEERAIAIVGPAGIGKTTLAEHVLQLWKSGPAYILRLESEPSVQQLLTALSGAIGCQVDAIHNAMGRGHDAMVLLDGMDAPPGAVVELLDGWLASNSSLRIVMTSRRRPKWSRARLLELGALSEDAAIALFEARARSAQPDLELPTTSEPTLRGVVTKLDRVPEAIELAAQRMQVLSLDALDARLTKPRIGVGAGSDPRGPMRKAFDDAWGLIGEVGRVVLSHSALFVGEFDAATAEEVIVLPDDGPSVPTVLETLQEHSLVSTRVRGGAVRFWMLDSIRRFALARLDESGHRALVESRVLGWAIGHSEALLKLPSGGRQDDAVDASWDNLEVAAQLALDRDLAGCMKILTAMSLVAGRRRPITQLAERITDAWTWAGQQVPPPTQAELVSRSSTTLMRHGNAHRVGQNLDAVLRQKELSPAARARLHTCRGRLAMSQGVLAQVESDLEDARRHLGDLPERAPESLVLDLDARRLMLIGSLEQAHEVAMDSFVLAQDSGSSMAAAEAALLLATLAHRMARHDDARGQLAVAREYFTRVGDRGGLSRVDCAAGALELERADGQLVAQGYLEAALETARTFGDLDTAGWAHGYLGLVAVELNHHETADQHFGGAAYAHRRTSRLGAAIAVGQLGLLELKRGRSAIAERRLTDGCRALQALGALQDCSLYNGYRALTLLVRGDREASIDVLDELPVDPRYTAARNVSDYVRQLTAGGQGTRPERPGLHDRLVRHLSASAGLASTSSQLVLHLERQGRWFRVGTQDTTELGHRKPMRRIVLELASRRVSAPGTGMSTEEIFEAGWPDERASEESAKNRVYVTIRRLRSGGLGAVLLNDDSGYYLDPNVTIAWAPG